MIGTSLKKFLVILNITRLNNATQLVSHAKSIAIVNEGCIYPD